MEEATMSKPFKGEIHLWHKRYFDPKEWARQYPADPTVLGYSIAGTPVGHPVFQGWLCTSPVIAQEGNEIETLNSRYTLVGEER